MKTSLALGIILAAFSTAAMAETPAVAKEKTAEMPAAKGDEHKHHMHDRMGKRMERMWKEMDANSDGTITREESTAFGNKKFDERDANKDGKVTRAEWDAFGEAKMKERKAKMEAEKGEPMGDKKEPAAPTDSKK